MKSFDEMASMSREALAEYYEAEASAIASSSSEPDKLWPLIRRTRISILNSRGGARSASAAFSEMWDSFLKMNDLLQQQPRRK